MNRTTLILIGSLSALGAAATWSAFTPPSNCGGNSAALAEVRGIALIACNSASEAPDQAFRFTAPNPEQREQLISYARTTWLPTARFLVTTGPVFDNEAGPRRVIVVCDTPYRNVPRRWIGSAPPTHAAGYSDGSSGLISTAEFAALDRSAFRSLDELVTPKSK